MRTFSEYVMSEAALDAASIPCKRCGGMMRRVLGRHGMFYKCDCGDTAGSDGKQYDFEDRMAKMAAHQAFDNLWRKAPNGRQEQTRRQAYQWLAAKLGVPEDECHIRFFDKQTCMRVVSLISALGRRDFRSELPRANPTAQRPAAQHGAYAR